MAFPAWVALIKASPGLFMVAVDPVTETTVVFDELKVIGKPDDAVAESVKSASPYVLSTSSAKLITWTSLPAS